jgi:hypothetical protein
MRILLLLSLALALAGLAFGESADSDTAATTTTLHEASASGSAVVQGEEEEEEEEEPKSEVAIVFAGTYESESEKNFFTLGAEYEYRFIPKLGVSAAVEWVFESDGREFVFVVPAVYHVTAGLRLLAGPGFEHAEDTSFLFRVGVNYAFEFGERYAIIPSLEFDFINGEDSVTEAVVYGVNFGVSF